MQMGPKVVEIAALVGDPARAMMLNALLDGRALTASELADAAGVTPQTASAHLRRLAEAQILALEQQGRHRYFRLASPLVARMLEGIMAVAEASPAGSAPRWRHGEPLRLARTCYDHLAGRLAVGMADTLVARRHVVLGEDGGEVTTTGETFFGDLGIDLRAAAQRRRIFCKPCLDWSERRPHLGGAVGAALAARLFELDWLRRGREPRVASLTPRGRRAIIDTFGPILEAAAASG